jgi:uncharacterized protein YggE
MKRNYQGVLNRIKAVATAHPQINSVDTGRELEFDTTKLNQWPRFFIRTETSPVVGGQGSVEISVNFTFLLMDRMNTKRTNTDEVLNLCHSALTDVLATLNKEGLIRVTDNPTMSPLYDYQDTQTAGWQVGVRVYLDSVFQCYNVP